jgi:poly(A) polymerase
MTAAADQPEFSIAGAEWLTRKATQCVFEALTATGHEARAVGGCVRDTLLARLDAQNPSPNGPIKVHETADIDIATTSTPDETIRLAEKAGLRAIPTGLAHGTITVISDTTPYEVTTLRHDVETYGRHADVAFTDDWILDAARRDFTINALYANPDGSIFDPLNARADLENRRVRFVGDPHQRIQEDFLRILRFFRFFARFGDGLPESDSLEACISERAGLTRLSRERIGHEIMRLLVARNAAPTIAIMAEHGLLTQVLPIAPITERLSAYVEIEEQIADGRADPAMRLGALAVAVEEDATRLQTALRLSNPEFDALLFWARTIRDLRAMSETTGRPREDRELKALLYRNGPRNYARRLMIEACLRRESCNEATLARDLELPGHWPRPEFPISGRDLLELGVPPGPAIGDWLSKLETEWVEADFSLSDDELRHRAARLLSRREN